MYIYEVNEPVLAYYFLRVYHRERIYFSSTPSCIKEEEEITKPPEGA